MQKKVLLMGRSGAGKTSMRTIIFSNYVANDTRHLGATIDVDASQIRVLGEMRLDLWDCGGQESFMDSFLTSQRDNIFRHVHTLIYIFDVESPDQTTDMHYFTDCLEALAKNHRRPTTTAATAPGTTSLSSSTSTFPGNNSNSNSNNSNGTGVGNESSSLTSSGMSADSTIHTQEDPIPYVYVLIHKMDLVGDHRRQAVFESKKDQVVRKCAESGWHNVKVLATSIWDESLYRAWSQMVSTLVPNLDMITSSLDHLAAILPATEVVLFDRTTFIVVSKSTSQDASHAWEQARFEKISQCVKIFRLECQRLIRAQFSALHFRHANFTAVLDVLTPECYIMVVATDPSVHPAGIEWTIKRCRPHFEKTLALTGS